MEKYTITDLDKQIFHYGDFDGIIEFAEANGFEWDEEEIWEKYENTMGSDDAFNHHLADEALEFIGEKFLDETVTIAVINAYWTIVPYNYYGD